MRTARRMVTSGGWLAIAAATAAACGALAALGDAVGAPAWTRVASGVVVAVLLVLAALLTVRQQTEAARADRHRQRRSLERLERLSRGVLQPEEEGEYFTGRVRVLREIVAWLDAATPEPGLLVIVGDPGSGKSAVIGRVVVAADRDRRSTLDTAAAPEGTLPSVGAIDLFLDAKDQTVAGIAAAVGDEAAVSAATPDELLDALVLRREQPFTLVVDSLDEAGEQAQAIARWLSQLADRGQSRGIRVLVATRPGGPHRELVRALGNDAKVCDLDSDDYFDIDDLAAAVEARLVRDPAAPSGYRADPQLAQTVAAAVAERARPSFLVAWAAVRGLLLRSSVLDTREEGWRRSLPADARQAMAGELDPERFASSDERRRALDLLTALAYARGSGLPLDRHQLWPKLANAIGETTNYDGGDVEQLFSTAAADLVDRTLNDDGTSSVRLFHEELSAHLRMQRDDPETSIQQRISVALLASVPAADGRRAWEGCSSYVRDHLAGHAASAGALGELLGDPGFLLAADQDSLRVALVRGALAIGPTMEPARVALVHALVRNQPTRSHRAASLFMALRRQGEEQLAHRVERELVGDVAPGPRARVLPYRLISAPSLRPALASVPDAHSPWVYAMAVIEHDGEPLIVSGGGLELRSWRIDGRPGPLQEPNAHALAVSAVAIVEHDGEPLVVTVGSDGAVRSWRIDGRSGPVQVHATDPLEDQWGSGESAIHALAVVEHDGEPLVVAGCTDGALRTWRFDGREGPLRARLPEIPGKSDREITTLAMVDHEGEPLIVTGARDGALRTCDLDAYLGPLQQVEAHGELVEAVAVLEHDGEPLVVSGGRDGALRSWRLDGRGGPLQQENAHAASIAALAVLEHDGEPLVVSGGRDGALRSWRLFGGAGPLQQEDAHAKFVSQLATIECEGEPIVVSGGGDGALRSWRLEVHSSPREQPDAHSAGIQALTVVEHGDEPLVVSGDSDGALRSWRLDGRAGALRLPDAHAGSVEALAVAEHGGEPLVISSDDQGALQSWLLDGRSGPLQQPDAHTGMVWALTVVEHGGEPLLVCGDGWSVRSWRLDGRAGPLQRPDCHAGKVRVVTTVEHDGEPLVVTGSGQGELRSWRLDGRPGPLQDTLKHGTYQDALAAPVQIEALVVVEHDGEPLLITGGGDRAVRSWTLDGHAGPLEALDAHGHPPDRERLGTIHALAVVEHDGEPLVVSGGTDRALRSWWLDGRGGPFQAVDVHAGPVRGLAGVEHDGEPLVVSAGEDGAVIRHALSEAP